ncbi:MAG TPA: hypothetical protein VE377_06990 [Candidatus Dormibacteraeota bacterium]|nr:hypothetical protein [Candidatus Dormibacteraeota bacterium]
MNRTSRVVVAGLFLAMLPLLCFAQARPSGYDPAAEAQSPKPKDGFVDFALKRINPADTDYGQCLDEGRKLLLEETMRNAYFWSNLVALGLLAGLFVIIVYQHRVQTCREWTAAEMLAQYEHSLSRANAQLEEATSRNRGLMEALTTLRESALRSPLPPGEAQDRPALQTVSSRTSSIPASQVATPKNGNAAAPSRSARAATAAPPANQIGLFKPEVDLVMKVNSLEQQLGRSQDEAKLLRRQLNESDRRLQEEQQRNRSLKGA